MFYRLNRLVCILVKGGKFNYVQEDLQVTKLTPFTQWFTFSEQMLWASALAKHCPKSYRDNDKQKLPAVKLSVKYCKRESNGL